MQNLRPARRKRILRALKPEITISSTDMTGLMPFLPDTEDEEIAYRQMYPTHKAHRD